jgi:hypothetical protein
MIGPISHGQPARWTGITALVRGVSTVRDGLSGDVAAVAVDLGEDRRGAYQPDAGRRCHEGARRHHDFVARADLVGTQRQLKRERAIGERDPRAAPEPLRHCRLERAHIGPGPLVDLPGPQHFDHGADLVIGVEWPMLVRTERERLRRSMLRFRDPLTGC